MTRIRLKPDTLDEENRKFSQERLPRPLFLNSVPKSGSHLLKNIMRMFVPVEDHFKEQFIQWGNLQQYKHAFRAEAKMLSWGHLLFSDASAVEAAPARKIILVRDPHTWVLARARFFLSDEFGDNSVLVKNGELTVDSLINLMIFGIHGKAMSMRELFTYNAVAWEGSDATMLRYEDLVQAVKTLGSDESDAYFMALFEAAGLASVPDDWQERVRIGSDRKQSGTARENLSSEVGIEIPKALTERQKEIVEFAAPGLRALLGYT
ncbi:hypothetical protein OZN62_05980 [Aurantiacibacter sp. MUD11]|uniref:hypothetical protein n=1 Tax=Aurantiacibacter sp. MUD11 TaxID=3003265 RepID=UPI0022AA1D1A|nr:hypothetical protein [Aurantiacibacter sp. MUD11]WAT19112.1 hypothetical protein OZN62_05980 [Aurantiacibacter sp. MUD11]